MARAILVGVGCLGIGHAHTAGAIGHELVKALWSKGPKERTLAPEVEIE